MNTLFRNTAKYYRIKWYERIASYISIQGAQNNLLKDLNRHENRRKDKFHFMHFDFMSNDILDRAESRAIGNMRYGNITAAEFYKIKDKIDALRKLRFTEGYDKFSDPEMYMWMKYKVASDVGGTKEREAFKLYEQTMINKRGEVGYKLFRERIFKNPQAKGLVAHY